MFVAISRLEVMSASQWIIWPCLFNSIQLYSTVFIHKNERALIDIIVPKN